MAGKQDPDAIEPAPEAVEETVTTPSAGSWWSPWLEAAKSKSTEVYEFVRKDLNEISTVVKSEASAVVNSTASVLKDTLKFDEESTASNMKKSMSSFLESVGNVLSPAADDEGEEAILIQNDTPVQLSRFQTRLFALIKNPESFTLPVESELMPQFESWLSVADEQMTRERLTKLLVASPDLHNQYEAFVPEKVSHVDFWQRYLFRKALLEDEESFKEAQEKRDQALAAKVQWEKESFAEGIDLTEEEQMKILAEYEEEQKTTPTKPSEPETKSPQKSKKTPEKAPAKTATASSKNPKESSKRKSKKEETKAETPTTAPSSKASEELIMKERKDMVVVSESGRVSSSSENSKDTDDWEKDFDLEEDEK